VRKRTKKTCVEVGWKIPRWEFPLSMEIKVMEDEGEVL